MDAQPMEGPTTRGKRPVCGIVAWILPLVAVPLGLLIGHVLAHTMDTSDFKGMGAGLAIMAFMLLPAVIAVPASVVLVIVSWCRQERYPVLGVALILVYVFAFAWLVGG